MNENKVDDFAEFLAESVSQQKDDPFATALPPDPTASSERVASSEPAVQPEPSAPMSYKPPINQQQVPNEAPDQTEQKPGQLNFLGEETDTEKKQPVSNLVKEGFVFPTASTPSGDGISEAPASSETTAGSETQDASTDTAPEGTPEGNAAAEPSTPPTDPFAAVIEQEKDKQIEQILSVLRTKNPIIQYGNKDDEITDKDETFNTLKKKLGDDFSEFVEGKVSWQIEYGKETSFISNTGEKIHDVKQQIEKSERFREKLLKAKTDKDRYPVCYVKPKVTGKNKGVLRLPNYKEHCETLEEAQQSHKPIIILPSKDGRLYRMERTEVGQFIAPAQRLPEFQQIETCFNMALPKIPERLLYQTIAFFRHIWDSYGTEALAMIRYNKSTGEYRIDVPEQKVRPMKVSAPDIEDLDSDSVHVLDIHSHHIMKAKFSPEDDRDEKATGLYAVVGRLDMPVPDITLRASCDGVFFPISLADVFDLSRYSCFYPASWNDKVHIKQKTTTTEEKEAAA